MSLSATYSTGWLHLEFLVLIQSLSIIRILNFYSKFKYNFNFK